MKNNVKRNALGFVLAALAASVQLDAATAVKDRPADGTPTKAHGTVGKARILAPVQKDAQTDQIRVPVVIDIGEVLVDGRAAVLGAYVVDIVFDPAKVEFLDALPGTTKGYTDQPSATPHDVANRQGLVGIVADQEDESGPVGSISVATARFREIVPGGAATIRPRIGSLASALRRDTEGRFITDLEIPVEPEKK